jgi:hypothetical protein
MAIIIAGIPANAIGTIGFTSYSEFARYLIEPKLR